LTVGLVGAARYDTGPDDRPPVRRGALPSSLPRFAAERIQDGVTDRAWSARIEGRPRPSWPDEGQGKLLGARRRAASGFITRNWSLSADGLIEGVHQILGRETAARRIPAADRIDGEDMAPTKRIDATAGSIAYVDRFRPPRGPLGDDALRAGATTHERPPPGYPRRTDAGAVGDP
jgi:hypothetical protein